MKFKDNVVTGGGGKHFLKFKAGDSHRGVFRGEPYDFKIHWAQGHTTPCAGDECTECKAGNKTKFRFRLNFITLENGAYVAKIFEQGAKVYNQLKGLASEYELEGTAVKIQRFGSTKDDTSYSVMPLPTPLTDDIKQKISAVKLHDLASPSESGSSEPDESGW